MAAIDEIVMAVSTLPVRVGGQRLPPGTPFEVSRRELEGMDHASEWQGEEKSEVAQNDRTTLIKVAVAEAIGAEPSRSTPPTVESVQKLSGLADVKAAEIKAAFDEIKAGEQKTPDE